MTDVETRHIPLPDGSTLDVEIMPEFLNVLKKHYNLSHGDVPTDAQVRDYVIKAFVNAAEKAEANGE